MVEDGALPLTPGQLPARWPLFPPDASRVSRGARSDSDCSVQVGSARSTPRYSPSIPRSIRSSLPMSRWNAQQRWHGTLGVGLRRAKTESARESKPQ
jgi:hypothetical protein